MPWFRPGSWQIPVLWAAAVIFMAVGCSKKPSVSTALARLEDSFADQRANQFVSLAVSAIRTNDYAVGVIVLQKAQRVPGMTADQLMTVQSAIQSMTAELMARAARGDARAQAELAAIERSRSQ